MDIIVGTNRDEEFEGTSENDVLIGGRGSDIFNAGAGDDVITTDASNGATNRFDQDILLFGDITPGSIGNDTITDFDTNNFNGGESNFDTLSFSFAGRDFNLSTGADIIDFVGFIGSDGNASTSAIQDGNDIIFVFHRNDDGAITDSITIQNIIGDDGITQNRLNDVSIDTLTDADIFISSADDAQDVVQDDETLTGTNAVDFIVGTNVGETINGLDAPDNIAGNGGNDTIIGGAGNDFLTGGANSDTFVFSEGSDFDTISDFEIGTDQIDLRDFDFTSFDDLNFVEQNGFVNLFIDENTSIALTNIDDISDLSAGDFILESSDDTDVDVTPVDPGNDPTDTAAVTGTDGDDILVGTDGNDTINGGDGDDELGGGAGDDVLNGGSGNDRLLGGSDGAFFDDTGSDELNGGTGLDVLVGGDGDDVLNGGDDRDLLFGGDGDDVLSGGNGQDDLSGGDGNDVLLGGAGDDLISGGNSGDDILDGGAGNDLLLGDVGDDFIVGGNGDDELIGGSGNDLLTGGAGADIFDFSQGDGFDTITDFVSGEDQIDLSDFAGLNDFNDINLVEQNNSVFIFIDENTSIELTNINDIDDLSADDFIL